MKTASLVRRLLGCCLLALAALATSLAWSGEVTLRSFQSKALHADYRYTIYLPDGYESGRLKYPVLYLLHGNGGDENEWLVKGQVQPTVDVLIKEGRVPLNTLRADIDFARYEATTTYGKIGLKVWIYKGEIIVKKRQKGDKHGVDAQKS